MTSPVRTRTWNGKEINSKRNQFRKKMFSSFSNLVWGAPEEQPGQTNNGQVSFDDSKVIEDDWVLIEEITNHNQRQQDGSNSQGDERASSLQTLLEENKPSSSGEISPENENLVSNDKNSVGNLRAEKQSDSDDKSSLEILFAEVQPNDTENKDDSDCSMKTDETDVGEKSSLQFLFDESLSKETKSAGNDSTSVFTLKPLVDPPAILPPNDAGQPRMLYKSYSADCYREQPEITEPTVLRRRHLTRASKRSGESATAFEGNVVIQKRTKQPSEGTSGVGRGQETRGRTRRANSVACGQVDNNHSKRRKRTSERFSGKGGRRNC